MKYDFVTSHRSHWIQSESFPHLGPVSRKSRRLFGPEKPFIKLRLAYSVKLIFSYVVKGIKIQITAKFRASRRLCFEDTKRIMSIEEHPKSFGTFKKRAPGESLLGDYKEGRTGGSLAQFTNLKNRGSWFTDIKNSFSRITKIKKLDTL